jgi:hypothetical protein
VTGQKKLTTMTVNKTVNGMKVDALFEMIGAKKNNPEFAKFSFRPRE